MNVSAWWSRAGLGTIFLAVLLGLGGAASRPGGWLVGLPSLSAAVVFTVIFGAVWFKTSRGREAGASTAAGLLPIVVLAASGLPLPGLRALTGPPLLALALAGLVGVIANTGWRPPRWVFFPVVFVLYALASYRVQCQVGPQGDEPHYLMVAESLLRDGDLSLEGDYAGGRYQAFFDGPLSPHYRVRGRGGEIYSLHAVGLSLLILPAYAAGGYPAVSFFMALLAALLAREIRELLREAWDGDGIGEAVAWVVALGPPLIHYAGLLFTEAPAALLLALALRRARRARALRPPEALLVGLVLAFLPWLNVRFAPLALVVALYALWQGVRLRVALAVSGPLVASAAALAFYHHVLYGFFDPRLVYGRRPEFSLSTLPEGLPGLLLDQEFGLLVYAPVFALAVPGLVRLWRRDRRAAAAITVAVGATLLTAGTWHMWRGGFNPPARFLVPVVPFLAVAVASALRARVTAGSALLIGFTVWAGCLGAAEPRLVHRDRDGTAPFWRAASGAEEWTRLLPGYVLADPERHALALTWGLALGVAALARGRLGAGRLALASAGLLAAAGVASSLSPARTGGRDAARLVGRPALRVPGWRLASPSRAEWGGEVLDWGPLYEPHRHPDGATLGERLALRPGTYRIALAAEDLGSGPAAPYLDVWAEGTQNGKRSSTFRREGGGFEADFTVDPSAPAVTLLLRGGGPLLLRRVFLTAQPYAGGPV